MSTPTDQRKIFVFRDQSRDLNQFESVLQQAERLKPLGDVVVNVGAQADKAWHELPENGSSWHEHGTYHAALYKFFPHPKIAPHLPAKWVQANQKMLETKTRMLQERGMGASFWASEPFHMPHSFFEEHPHLRGPRVDHPRRSRDRAFAMCVDSEEGQEIYAWMMQRLREAVPNLRRFEFMGNDSGSGFCWAFHQYGGPNGPAHCRGRNAGARIGGFYSALQRGAEAGGGRIDMRMTSGSFEAYEVQQAREHGPAELALGWNFADEVRLSSFFAYPVLGLIDPLAVVTAMQRAASPQVRWVWLGISGWYDRATDHPSSIEKLVDLVEQGLKDPTPPGRIARLQRLHRIACQWAGQAKADDVFDALVDWHEAFTLARTVAPEFDAPHGALSLRYITRPLLLRPQVLSPQEEAYFLPYIFNRHEDLARTDYADRHGYRISIGGGAELSFPALNRALQSARRAAGVLADAADGPQGAWLGGLATSIRMWASLVESCNNFYFAQVIRDRNADLLASEEKIVHSKEGPYQGLRDVLRTTFGGSRDRLAWYHLLRSELDNTHQMIRLLESGGLDRIARARDAEHQDTFLLGPNLLDDLKTKVALMTRHWCDAELYFEPPVE